ncbi:MAG: hypothetical protein J1E01_02625 [Acetatifactor sp.]|nr:hypothetical protein [Acetatifactor sp.]
MSTVLSAVYNNYLSTYTRKPLTRYDAHKKSELRSVYNSIVKMNRDAPWYLPTTSKATQNYAVDLKENARGLYNTIAQIGGLEEDGLFSKKSAYSSDEEIVSASYIGPQKTDGPSPTLELEVLALASPQENLGLFLPNEKSALLPDTYSFDLGINDMNYEFQFSVSGDETNRDIQERLMRLLNNSGTGIKADIVESDDRTALRLTSDATGLSQGKQQLFTVSDDRTSKASGTVEYFGLDYVSRQAANASLLVNGEERTASSNHLTIGKMFDITLKGLNPAGSPIQIGLKTDVESLADNVNHLISGYNDFMKAASSYMDTQIKSGQLVRELKGIALVYGSPLASMGFTMAEDGTLELDKDTLRQTASQSSDISETFGYLKNFSNKLLSKSNQVSLNPMEYVEKTMVAYKNPGHSFINPYATSAYSGMMFNGYC